MVNALKNVRRLRGLGVFDDYAHSAEIPNFNKFNLIYGFNGSGKATLSRVIRSIETGQMSPQLPVTGEFAVEFSDGTICTQDKLNGKPNTTVLVFNEDFIEENLRWREGKASPVYFIGKEQGRRLLLLEKLTARLEKRNNVWTEAEQARSRAEGENRTLKTDLARLIAEELNLGRRYTATQLDADYAAIDLAKFSLLSEGERQVKKVLINKVAPGAAIIRVGLLQRQLIETLVNVKTLCDQTLATGVIADLQAHPSMLKWVKDGLEYHQHHSLATCLFCGNGLSKDRVLQLQQSIDDRFASAAAAVEQFKADLEIHTASIRALRESLPARADFDDSLASAYQSARSQLIERLAAIERALSGADALLKEKAKTPNLRVPTDSLELSRVQADIEAANERVSNANELIEKHNNKIARFQQEKSEAAEALKAHYLIEASEGYSSVGDKFKRAEREARMRATLHARLQDCIESLRRELRSHGLAVELINKLLAAYLGHGEVALNTLEEGYQIQRRGAPIVGPLSEGEKTAVALSYFLSKLEENGRKRRDLIMVVDDPISSLDSRALNYALNLIRSALDDVGQVVLLTHNLQFMNEIKKWLKPLSKSSPPTAAMYFLDVRLGSDGKRSAAIKPLPKLLRDYDSEYHYLFSLVLAFLAAEAENAHLGYVLPNVIRKVLELFLMFKLPGPDGLGSKLKHPSVRDCGVGEARINALYRLVELESHGDNLDDLVSFSAMTVEESRDAANALIALMASLDSPHLKRMRELCS